MEAERQVHGCPESQERRKRLTRWKAVNRAKRCREAQEGKTREESVWLSWRRAPVASVAAMCRGQKLQSSGGAVSRSRGSWDKTREQLFPWPGSTEESGQWLEVAVGVMAFSIFISGLFRQGTPGLFKC